MVVTVLAVIAIVDPGRRTLAPAQAQAAPVPGAVLVTGVPRVIDGDTLEMAGERIRLHGIDAFESRQTCGSQACGRLATAALKDLIRERPTSCEVQDIDRYGRLVSVCRVEGIDVGSWMVGRGHAVAYRRYGRDYVMAETSARKAGAGAWATTFDDPELWRGVN